MRKEGLTPLLVGCFANFPMRAGDWSMVYRNVKEAGGGDDFGAPPSFGVLAVQSVLVKDGLQSIARDNRVARGIIRKKKRKCMLDCF